MLKTEVKLTDNLNETAFPPGDYAIVEVLGHRTYVGRIEEVERFGSKLMAIQPIYAGQLLEQVLIGGGSIYQFTPCSADVALARAPREAWQLPTSVRATLPPTALPAPESEPDFIDYAEDADPIGEMLDD